jgi:hypothetical protein
MDEAGTGRHRRRAGSGATTSAANVVCDGPAVAVERRRSRHQRRPSALFFIVW